VILVDQIQHLMASFRHARESGHPGETDAVPDALGPAFAGATEKRRRVTFVWVCTTSPGALFRVV
jgi:hypothetical protein